MPGTAREYYEQGVRLSFEQYGVDGAAAYLESTGVPDVYEDPLGTYSYANQLTQVTPKWNDAAGFEEMQERIIIQKWIANWLLGCESWADWRRTGYPVLIPAKEFGSTWGVSDAVSGARRMPYPEREKTSNSANYRAAVSELLGGEDNMATRLWFDCKIK